MQSPMPVGSISNDTLSAMDDVGLMSLQRVHCMPQSPGLGLPAKACRQHGTLGLTLGAALVYGCRTLGRY